MLRVYILFQLYVVGGIHGHMALWIISYFILLFEEISPITHRYNSTIEADEMFLEKWCAGVPGVLVVTFL